MERQLIKTNLIHPDLLGSCLPIKYNIISLPNIAIDFQFQYFDIPCSYCKVVGAPSYICLTCGKKLCNFTKYTCDSKEHLFDHNVECCGGNGIYLDSMSYSIIIVDRDSDRYKLDIPFYINKFGESVDHKMISREIKMNEKEEINKALNIFINHTWTMLDIYNGDNGFQS